MGIKARGKQEKYDKIMESKMAIPIETLCEGMPSEFATYMTYCRNLRFDEKPDYAYMRRLFKELYVKQGYEWDNVFDWTIVDNTSKSEHGTPRRSGTPRRQKK